VEMLDINSATGWLPGTPLASGIILPGIAVIPNSNEVFLLGGRDSGSLVSKVVIYNVELNTTETVATMDIGVHIMI